MRKNLTLLLLGAFLLGCQAVFGQNFKFKPDNYSSIAFSDTIADPLKPATYNDTLPMVIYDQWSNYVAYQNGTFFPGGYFFKSMEDVVSVGIRHDSLHVKNYRYAINLRILRYSPSHFGLDPPTDTNITLEVSYNRDSLQSYRDLMALKFSGYLKYRVIVTGILDISNPLSVTTVSRTALAKNFFIQSEINAQRYVTDYQQIVTDGTPINNNQRLKVYWLCTKSGTNVGYCKASTVHPQDVMEVKPMSYEIEWTYIDDYGLDLTQTTPTPTHKFQTGSDVTYDFRKNATRVRTDKMSFEIPLTYERGAIVFRVRGLRPETNYFRDIEYSDWTLPDSGVVYGGGCFDGSAYLIQNAHQNDSLNWQYTIGFRDEGKYKHIIHYFDGALYGRETQTKLNTDDNYIIAADKAYDYEGRPVISSLPTPVQQTDLKYRGDVLINAVTSRPYKAADFDKAGCIVPDSISMLSNSASANIYYSPLNPDTAGMQRFVPDAKGYPIVQSILSPDKTAKPLWEGGAGRELQLWKGHATHYDYVQSVQPELDKLMGTEVGHYEYYPKQVTTDPNGQSSFTIYSPTGQVVANGLMGLPDTAGKPIDLLSDYSAGDSSCTNLLYGFNQNKTTTSLSAFLPFYSDKDNNPYRIQYSASVPAFNIGCGKYLWTKAIYTLDVSTDCGVPVTATSDSVGKDSVLTANTAAYTSSQQFNISLPLKGRYMADKKLAFSKENIKTQVGNFILANEPTCYHDDHYFIRNSVDAASFPCIDSGSISRCELMRQQMIEQLYPNAKYGHYFKNADSSFHASDTNSIFYPIPFLNGAHAAWNTGLNASGLPIPATSWGSSASPNTDPHWSWSGNFSNWQSVYQLPANGLFQSAQVYIDALQASATGQFNDPNTPWLTSAQNISGTGWQWFRTIIEINSININTIRCHFGGSFETAVQAGGTNPLTPVYYINGQLQAVPANWDNFQPQGLQIGMDTLIFRVNEAYNQNTNSNLPVGIAVTFTNADTGAFCKYQSPCLSLPVSATFHGKQYTNLASLPVDTFIKVFNDTVAQSLLPLHPEFCKLSLCDDGTFEKQLQALQTFQQADAANRSMLDSLAAHDPLYVNADVSVKPIVQNNLLHFNHSRRIDSVAIEQTYCSAGNLEESQQCISYLYPTEIASISFINDAVHQKYYENLIASYEANRNLVEQQMMDASGNTCQSCAAERLHLTGDPVVPTIFASNGTLDTSLHLSGWIADAYNNALNGDTTGMGTVPQGVTDSLNLANGNMCDGQVDNIIKALANCSLDTNMLPGHPMYQVHSFLITRCNGSNGGNIKPETVDSALTYAGLQKNDLCHPFLATYGLFNPQNDVVRGFSCGDSALYAGLTQFLNRAEIISSITSATSFTGGSVSSSLALSSSNPYEAKLITAIGNSFTVQGFNQTVPANTSGGMQFVKLLLQGSNSSISLYLRSKAHQSVAQLNGLSSISFNSTSCINNDLSSSSEGWVAQNTALVNTTTNSGTADYYVWTKEIALMAPSDAAALAGCITCVDIKRGVEAFYADSTTWHYDATYNHPLFSTSLTNYLNYKLNKHFSFEDYDGLMRGCALSDKIEFRRYAATYNIVLAGGGSSFLSALQSVSSNALPDYVTFNSGNTLNYWIDLNSVPKNQILLFKSFLDGYGQSVVSRQYRYYVGADVLLTQDTLCSSISVPSSVASVNMAGAIQLLQGSGGSYPYTYYTLLPSGTSPVGISNSIAAVKDSIKHQCPSRIYLPVRELLRSSDYATNAKQQYLAYVYGMGSSSHDAIVAAIAPNILGQQLSAYSGKTITYYDPYCIYRKRDLYLYDATQSSAPGYSRVSSVLASCGMLFPSSIATTVNSALHIYHKANGDYWYRFFDATNHLYNFYITPPQNGTISLNGYSLDYIRVAQGVDSSRRFIAYVHHSSAPTVIIPCAGYADFTVGYSQRVSNVVLLDKGTDICTDTADCEHDALNAAIGQGQMAYALYYDSVRKVLADSMLYFVVNNTKDTLIFCSQDQKYHFTLYYYDRAGNLMRTVPPAGVQPITAPYSSIPGIRDNSNSPSNPATMTAHKKVSYYRYDAQGKKVWEQTPDGGTTYFFYDAAGRLIFLQNSKQRPTGDYSYVLYDAQQRPIETGQVKLGCTQTNASGTDFDTTHCTFTRSDGSQYSSIHPEFVQNVRDNDNYPMSVITHIVRSHPRIDVVETIYDSAKTDLTTIAGQNLSTQENLLRRASTISYYPSLNASSNPAYNTGQAQFVTYLSYDMEGNIKTLTYDYYRLNNLGQRYKRVDYDYDLLSNQVNMVSYNRGRADQFYQRYEYDADNRITEAQTSNDGLIWNKDARYTYYKHGPLAQVQIGNQQIQSLEYAYTIGGWMKAINSDVLNPQKDMGKNGLPSDLAYARDVVAHALSYFSGDYKPIASIPATVLPEPTKALYNGNIVQQITGITGIGTMQRQYRYDQLQRVKLGVNAMVDDNALTVATPSNIYKSSYTYDPDGNILNLQRWNGATAPALIDNFTYAYNPYSNAPQNNRLLSVVDNALPTTGTDLQPGQIPNGNYSYDEVGNLTRDKQAHLLMDWTSFGSIKSIKDTVSGQYTQLDYDGKGNRIYKDVVKKTSADTERHNGEYYVRDGGGNILAIYRTRSTYSPINVLQAVNVSLSQAAAFKSFIAQDIAPINGFPLGLQQRAIRDIPGWVNTITDRPLSWYIDGDDELLNRLLFESGGNWITPLRDYDNSNEDYDDGIYSRALLKSRPEDVIPLFIEALNYPSEGTSLLTHFSAQMPEESANRIWTNYGLNYVGGDSIANGSALYNFMAGRRLQVDVANSLVTGMQSLTDEDYQQHCGSFYANTVNDDVIFLSPNLLTDGSRWEYALANVINRNGDKDALESFFDQWGDAANWMLNNTSQDYRLSAVYNVLPDSVVYGFIDNDSLGALTQVIADVPGLTVPEYANKAAAKNLAAYLPSIVNTALQDTIALAEHHFYGMDRLGVQTYDTIALRNTASYAAPNTNQTSLSRQLPWYSHGYAQLIDRTKNSEFGNGDAGASDAARILGKRYYELTDHLHNVIATVLDRKTGHWVLSGADTIYNYWGADEQSVDDYYPGGMPMGTRTMAMNLERHSYNGQMRDDEAYGVGVLNSAKFWEMNTNVLRRFEPDPVYNPYESRYAINHGNPIAVSDVNGDFGSWFSAKLYSLFHGGGNVLYNKKSEEWYTSKQVPFIPHDKNEGGLKLQLRYDWSGRTRAIGEKAEGEEKAEVPKWTGSAIEGFKIFNELVEKYGNLEKAHHLLEAGYFNATFNGQVRTWKLAFQGNQYVSPSLVKAEKTAFGLKAASNLKVLRFTKGLGILSTATGGYLLYKDVKEEGWTPDNKYEGVTYGVGLIPGYGWAGSLVFMEWKPMYIGLKNIEWEGNHQQAILEDEDDRPAYDEAERKNQDGINFGF